MLLTTHVTCVTCVTHMSCMTHVTLNTPLSPHRHTQSIWNWGRGTWPEIKIYGPPAGLPRTVRLLKPACRVAESNWQAGLGRSIRRPDSVAYGNLVRSPDRSASAGLSIGLGRPAGQFEKPNCTRPPGRTVWKNELYSGTRQVSLKNQTVLGRPAGGPYI